MSSSACYGQSNSTLRTLVKAEHFSSQRPPSNMSLGSHRDKGARKVGPRTPMDRQSTTSLGYSRSGSYVEREQRHVHDVAKPPRTKSAALGYQLSSPVPSVPSAQNSFCEDMVSLHPTSAVARRFLYSRKIGTLHSSSAKEAPPSSSRPPLVRQKAVSNDYNEASTKRNGHSLSASTKMKSKDTLTYATFSLNSQMSSVSLNSESTTSSSGSFYWTKSPSKSVSPKPMQEDTSSLRQSSVQISSRQPDALKRDTRAHFHHSSFTSTWNQERLFRAVIAEINRKYNFLLPFIDLRPPRHIMVGLFYTLPWKDITFELFFQEVEKRWVVPIYHRYRRAFVTTCMLYGGTN